MRLETLPRLLKFIVVFCLGIFSVFESVAQCDFNFIGSTTGCAPLLIKARQNPDANVTIRDWDVLDQNGNVIVNLPANNNPNNDSLLYIFSNPGTYSIRLVVTYNGGQTCTITKPGVLVYSKPTGSFSFNVVEGCSPLAVQVQCNYQANCATPGTLTVDWGGGGTPYSGTGCPAGGIINKVYTAPQGYYTPKFILTNGCGCDTTIQYDSLIHIINKPVANFTANTTTANCSTTPLNVTFTANNAGANMTYEWYIDNVLQSATGTTFNHVFPLSNVCYSIKLKVRHQSGGACADSLVRTNYICNRPAPSINFFQNITTACVDAQTPANLQLYNDPADGLNTLTWYLTGGSPSQTFAVQNNDRASYQISVPGNYTVTAIGSFGPGCSDTIIQQVLVARQKPQADFTVNDTFSCAVPFMPTYTAAPTNCTGCVYDWTIGLGTPGTGQGATISPNYTAFGCKPVILRVTSNNGCADTINRNGVCINRLAARIGMNRSKGCAPLCVNFSNNTVLTNIPDPIQSVCWQFPGSSFAGTCNTPVSNCYTTPGCSSVKMTIATTTGCVDSVTLVDTICVGTPPSCTMTASPLSYCFEADTTCFAITCPPNSFDYVRCDYGDGVIESVTSAAWCHYYQDTGVFYTKCIVFSDSCAGDTFDFVVNVFPPMASFSQQSGCSNSSAGINLINNSGGATSYLWNFCDGTTSTLASPTLNIPACSTCNVTLTAYGPNGCSHQKTLPVLAPCNDVGVTPTDTTICIGSTIRFKNTSTNYLPNSTRWDFNILPTISFGNGTQLGDSVSRAFNTQGITTIAMRNTSINGCIDTVFATVRVCKATADFGPTSVCLPLPICFQNLSVDTTCSITKYRWTYNGNNLIDTVANPCFTFPNPGSYQVKLYVENSLGCRDSITKTVIAATPVSLNYSVDTLLCPGSTSCVVNNSIGAPGVPLTYNWNIPNSNIGTSTSPNPCFNYSAPGNYPVYLQIASGSQCVVYDTFIVHNQFPIASGYINEDTIACPQPPVATIFTSTSQYYDSTLTWSFGNINNNQSNFPNATFFYTEPGVYPVRLRVRTKDGCVSTTWVDTVVVKGPYGTLTADPTGMCACKDTVTLSVSTVDATSLTLLYGCNFAGPSVNISPVGTAQNPTVLNFPYTYCVTDTCKPQLIFGDNAGCQVYLEQPPIVVDSPKVGFSFDNYGVCVNGIVCFQDTTRYHLPSNLSYTIKRVWNFGDSPDLDTTNNPSPCHYYSQPGGYTTKLWIYSNLGCIDSVINTVVVVPEFPIAGYYADDSLVCATVPLCFHDTSYIYPLTGADYWVWTWGDGKVDTVNTPDFCHAYDQGGYYRVTMCVYDSVGCPDCDSSTIIRVIDNPVANAGPDINVCYGITTQLNGSGGTSVHWEPAGLFVNPDVYSPVIPQLFTDTSVIIMVGDTFGCVDADTARLSISRVLADFTVGAQFCRDDRVCITDATTNINGTSVDWFYDFGAGDTVHAGANPCYVYPELSLGNYTVTQLVVNNNGCIDTATHTINILPSPLALFSLNDTVICSDQQICVTDLTTSQAPLQLWTWTYGDNTSASGQAPPCRAYTAPYQFTYTIQLYVEDQNSCSDTSSIVVTVNKVPTAAFAPVTTCETNPVALSSQATGQDGASIMRCEWLLWPGAPAPVIDTNCITQFNFAAGTYPVQLVVTDSKGCTDTLIKTVLVDSISQLTVTPGDTAICIGISVAYTVNGVFDQLVWQPSVWIDSPQSPQVLITPLADITYTISATNGVCAAASETFDITTISKIPVDVTATPMQIVLGLTSNISAQLFAPIDSIVWSPDLTLDCSNCPNPIATPVATTTYTATIYYSEQGTTCTTEDSVTIEVLNSCENSVIFVPNTFTPNADGLNDIFMIRGIAATKINFLRVFDRWGQMVFEVVNGEANEPRWGWDGTNRSGEKLNSAVYVYTYEIECINGEAVGGKGNVTLAR